MIEAQDVVGEAAYSREDAGIFADTRSVFAKGHVARVMGFVFDVPMETDGLCRKSRLDGMGGEVERDFAGGFPSSRFGQEMMDAPLDGDGGNGKGLPLRPGERRREIEDGDGARFMPVALFLIGCARAGKRGLRGASRFNRLPQARLIVLELNDEMSARVLGVLEGFFDSAMRRK